MNKEIVGIYKKQFWDNGPTFCAEMLKKYQNISLNRETAREWLREEIITISLKKKRLRPEKRERREGISNIAEVINFFQDKFILEFNERFAS